MNPRLAQLAAVLEPREYLVGGRLSVADILMADVLRVVDSQGGLAGFPVLSDYVARLTARPAFRKAHSDQMDHWASADAREEVAG
jgi:glutathione S-transferase